METLTWASGILDTFLFKPIGKLMPKLSQKVLNEIKKMLESVETALNENISEAILLLRQVLAIKEKNKAGKVNLADAHYDSASAYASAAKSIKGKETEHLQLGLFHIQLAITLYPKNKEHAQDQVDCQTLLAALHDHRKLLESKPKSNVAAHSDNSRDVRDGQLAQLQYFTPYYSALNNRVEMETYLYEPQYSSTVRNKPEEASLNDWLKLLG